MHTGELKAASSRLLHWLRDCRGEAIPGGADPLQTSRKLRRARRLLLRAQRQPYWDRGPQRPPLAAADLQRPDEDPSDQTQSTILRSAALHQGVASGAMGGQGPPPRCTRHESSPRPRQTMHRAIHAVPGGALGSSTAAFHPVPPATTQ